MDEGVDDSGGVFGLHVLKILVEDKLLHRLVAAYRQQDTGHFYIDTVVANIQGRHASNAVDAWLEDVAAAVAQDIGAQIQSHILNRFVASQTEE